MKLVSGSSECDGRVQIRYNEQWGAVCHSGWDLADATVLCRELDCGDTAELKEYVGPSGQILMGELACTGKELTVQDCPFTGWGVSSCLNGLHAGVFCKSKINLHVSLSNGVQLNNCHSHPSFSDAIVTNMFSLLMFHFTETLRKGVVRIAVKAKIGVNVNDPDIKKNLLDKVRFMSTFIK